MSQAAEIVVAAFLIAFLSPVPIVAAMGQAAGATLAALSSINRYLGWLLNSATDINVWGQIVGMGTLNGQPHGFLLTPRNPFKP